MLSPAQQESAQQESARQEWRGAPGRCRARNGLDKHGTAGEAMNGQDGRSWLRHGGTRFWKEWGRGW